MSVLAEFLARNMISEVAKMVERSASTSAYAFVHCRH